MSLERLSLSSLLPNFILRFIHQVFVSLSNLFYIFFRVFIIYTETEFMVIWTAVCSKFSKAASRLRIRHLTIWLNFCKCIKNNCTAACIKSLTYKLFLNVNRNSLKSHFQYFQRFQPFSESGFFYKLYISDYYFFKDKMTMFKNDFYSSISDPFGCRTGRPSSEERAAHWWTYPPTWGTASPIGQQIFVSANGVNSDIFKEISVIIKDLTIWQKIASWVIWYCYRFDKWNAYTLHKCVL
jgi:hypothetical protein